MVVMHNGQPVIVPDDYLAHHGILGMKWGVRRYQNKDGSLTANGRRHYSLTTSQYKKEFEQNYEKNKRNDSRNKDVKRLTNEIKRVQGKEEQLQDLLDKKEQLQDLLDNIDDDAILSAKKSLIEKYGKEEIAHIQKAQERKGKAIMAAFSAITVASIVAYERSKS